MIIADCNLIAYLHLPGQQSGLAEAILSKDAQWWVPPLWRPEFRNVLFAYVRTKGMTVAAAEAYWNDALSHLAPNQSEPEPARILAKAAATKLSAYDAEYVALAEQLSAPLVTADKEILRTCPHLAITLEDFLNS